MPTANLTFKEAGASTGSTASTVSVASAAQSISLVSVTAARHSSPRQFRPSTRPRRARLLRNLWLTASTASLLLCFAKVFLWLVHAHLAPYLTIVFHSFVLPAYWCWYAYKTRKRNAAANGGGVTVGTQASGRP